MRVADYPRPVSRFASWGMHLALFSVILVLGSWGAMRFGPLLQPHFAALYLLCGLLSLLAILFGVIGLSSLWRVGAKGGKASVAAILFALPVLAPGVYAYWLYVNTPPIYEASSDVSDLPDWLQQPAYNQMWLGARMPSSTGSFQLQRRYFPALVSHRYPGGLDRILEGARKAVGELKLSIQQEKIPEKQPVSAGQAFLTDTPSPIPIPALRPTDLDPGLPEQLPAEALLQGQAAGDMAGFHYDFVIRLREDGETTLADIRVMSRYGQFDLGGSARFAATFLTALDTALAEGATDG